MTLYTRSLNSSNTILHWLFQNVAEICDEFLVGHKRLRFKLEYKNDFTPPFIYRRRRLIRCHREMRSDPMDLILSSFLLWTFWQLRNSLLYIAFNEINVALINQKN